jgi:8-oxo-dGTP pyrophosphatase MutT (NUDIX family)
MPPAEDLSIMLRPSYELNECVDFTMFKMTEKEPELDRQFLSTYRNYQTLFNEELERYFLSGAFTHTLLCTKPIISVQNKIRQSINDADSKYKLPIVAGNIDRLVSLSGLSETGKSTAGEIMRTKNNVNRLKIHYFIAQVGKDIGIDPYVMKPDVLARKTIMKLSEYADMHYYQRDFSIESLKNMSLVAELKKALGGKMAVVYFECPRELAAQRSSETFGKSYQDAMRDIEIRDAEKNSHGCSDIKNIADHVIKNTGSVDDLTNDMQLVLNTTKEVKQRDSARGIVFSKDNELILIRRIKKGREYYVTPGGGIEPGESIRKALKREVGEEELGVAIKPLNERYLALEREENYDTFFFCREDQYVPRTKPTGNEYSITDPNNVYEIVSIAQKDIMNIPLVPNHLRNMICARAVKLNEQK